MFADNSLFWLGVRRLLLDFINLVEVELRRAGVYDGPTTSEIRQWWKKQKQTITVDISDMQEKNIVV